MTLRPGVGAGEEPAMGWRIGTLAKRHGLSRSTLLYYDRIGLLRPSGRSGNGYRQYDAHDDLRLGRIVAYRRTGASMRDIGRMLDGGPTGLRLALDQRLAQLGEEIAGLREQQGFILRLLRTRGAKASAGPISLATWVRLLRASGFGPEEMNQWHVVFERTAPAGHREFLQFLGLPGEEIARIRELSRRGGAPVACRSDPRCASPRRRRMAQEHERGRRRWREHRRATGMPRAARA